MTETLSVSYSTELSCFQCIEAITPHLLARVSARSDEGHTPITPLIPARFAIIHYIILPFFRDASGVYTCSTTVALAMKIDTLYFHGTFTSFEAQAKSQVNVLLTSSYSDALFIHRCDFSKQ